MNFNAEIEIDLKKLRSNMINLKEAYADYAFIFANLKNNAFGMGYGIVDTLTKNGVNYIYVSTLEEALEIRRHNKKVPILVNYEVKREYIYDAIMNNITITISSLEHLQSIIDMKLKDKLLIHLLIDNGCNKIGLNGPTEVETAYHLIKNNASFSLEGIYTELTTYGITDDDFYMEANVFFKAIQSVDTDNLIIHLNEPMMYHKKQSLVNGIRFDLACLGIEENIDDSIISSMKIKSIEKRYQDLEFPEIDLDLVFSIKATVISLNNAYKGTLIGKNYIARENLNLAILPIGHKDGITKAIGSVWINEKICPVVSDEIDHIIVSVPKDVKVGDTAKILNEESDIYSILGQLKTNRFYLMSILNNNLPRNYINEEEEDDIL